MHPNARHRKSPYSLQSRRRGSDLRRICIDEFAQLFAQLENMGQHLAIPETHKAPLLLGSLGDNSNLESTATALRLKEIEDLTWDSVTSDFIHESRRKNASKEIKEAQVTRGDNDRHKAMSESHKQAMVKGAKAS